MSLISIGNCRHYWEFNAANYSSGFADQVGSVTATLNTGSPTYTTANGVQGLDLSGGTQYLSFAATECLGEVSFIQVIGYRGGGQAYGLCTTTSVSGFNFWHGANSNNAQFFRSATAATTDGPLNQSGVNVTTSGVRLVAGQMFMRVDADAEVTAAAIADKNDAAINTHSGWQFGRRYTTLDPIQQVYEIAVYLGDVTTATGYADEIAALITKYAIT